MYICLFNLFVNIELFEILFHCNGALTALTYSQTRQNFKTCNSKPPRRFTSTPYYVSKELGPTLSTVVLKGPFKRVLVVLLSRS